MRKHWDIVLGLTVVLLALPLSLWAEDNSRPIFEFAPTRKIINVDALGLNANSSIRVVLDMVPELLSRDASNLYGNYSVQLDGKDVGESRDLILIQTRVAEVEAVEIVELPTVSEQRNGQGGVINIRLRNVGEGLHGNAMLDAEAMWDVMPSALLSYRKGQWMVRSAVMGEYQNTSRDKATAESFAYYHINRQDTLKTEYWQTTGKIDVQYAGKYDVVNMMAMVSYGSDDEHVGSLVERYNHIGGDTMLLLNGWNWNTAHSRKLMLLATADYTHRFTNDGSLRLAAIYNFSRTTSPSHVYSDPALMPVVFGGPSPDQYMDKMEQPHSLNIDLRTKQPLWRRDRMHELWLTVGGNTILQKGLNSSYMSDQRPLRYKMQFSPSLDYLTVNASPFVQLDMKAGRWQMQAGAKYQYFMRELQSVNNTTQRTVEHDVIANVSVDCRVADHHRLRLIAARNLIRPTNAQMDTVMIYNPMQGIYYRGAKDLHSTYVHNVNLHYVFDYKGQGHSVVSDVGVEYIHTDGPIRSYSDFDYVIQGHYMSYANMGKSNIMELNASLYYRYGIFSFAFAGNVFGRFSDVNGETRDNWYFNLCFTPVFRFKHEWAFSGKVMYNSRIKDTDREQGDYISLQLRLSKNWGPWNVHAEFDNVFNYLTTDHFTTAASTGITSYELYPRSFMIGAGYTF